MNSDIRARSARRRPVAAAIDRITHTNCSALDWQLVPRAGTTLVRKIFVRRATGTLCVEIRVSEYTCAPLFGYAVTHARVCVYVSTGVRASVFVLWNRLRVKVCVHVNTYVNERKHKCVEMRVKCVCAKDCDFM